MLCVRYSTSRKKTLSYISSPLQQGGTVAAEGCDYYIAIDPSFAPPHAGQRRNHAWSSNDNKFSWSPCLALPCQPRFIFPLWDVGLIRCRVIRRIRLRFAAMFRMHHQRPFMREVRRHKPSLPKIDAGTFATSVSPRRKLIGP